MYDMEKCCLFEFPEENNTFSHGYENFLVDKSVGICDLDQTTIVKVRWPMCRIMPPKQMLAASKVVKWKVVPARVIATGTYQEMSTAARNKEKFGFIQMPSRRDRKVVCTAKLSAAAINSSMCSATSEEAPGNRAKKRLVKHAAMTLMSQVLAKQASKDNTINDNSNAVPGMPLTRDVPSTVPATVPARVPSPVPFPVPSPVPSPIPFPVRSPVSSPVPFPVHSPDPSPVPTPVPSKVPAGVHSPVPSPVSFPILSPVPLPVPSPFPSPCTSPIPSPSTMSKYAIGRSRKRNLAKDLFESESDGESSDELSKKSKGQLTSKIEILTLENKRLRAENLTFKNLLLATKGLSDLVESAEKATTSLNRAVKHHHASSTITSPSLLSYPKTPVPVQKKRVKIPFLKSSPSASLLATSSSSPSVLPKAKLSLSTSLPASSSLSTSLPTNGKSSSSISTRTPGTTTPCCGNSKEDKERDLADQDGDVEISDKRRYKLVDLVTDVKRCRCNHKKPTVLASDLLAAVFGEEALANCSMTGMKSNNRAPEALIKPPLDSAKIAAIIDYVQDVFCQTPEACVPQILERAMRFKLNNVSKKFK